MYGVSKGRGVRWEIESIENGNVALISEKEILSVLKSALLVYGYRGVWRQLDECHIECDF